ncbi:MAG: hypothetical protein ACYCX2_02620 [Christensenellales bacterium]
MFKKYANKLLRHKKMVMTGGLLLLLSLAFYMMQIALFRKTGDTVFYLLQDLAFLPVQILLVSLLLGQILKERDRNEKRGKVYIVISAFFAQTGSALIGEFSMFLTNRDEFASRMDMAGIKKSGDFKELKNTAEHFDYEIDSGAGDLTRLKSFLYEKRDGLLSMFSNTHLIEHDDFTDLLWAVFHVADELSSRQTLNGLPKSDLAHISGDISRAYKPLVVQWIQYMQHLKREYPYLFSLAVRKNPFSENKSVVIQE